MNLSVWSRAMLISLMNDHANKPNWQKITNIQRWFQTCDMKRACNRLYCKSSQHAKPQQTRRRRGNTQQLYLCVKTLWSNILLDYEETTHMYTHTLCVILTWRSWWKTPVFVLEPPRLPCLQGDVTQRGEMNWVNPTHWVCLTKQRRAEWWFIVATVWPSSHMISWEPESQTMVIATHGWHLKPL